MAKAPPKSIFERSTKLLGLAAGLAQKELSGRISQAFARGEELQQQIARVRTQVAQARELVRSLGNLKGAAMKAGQFISIEFRDYLPPEVIEVLNELQAQAPEVDFAEIRSILLEELGAERLALMTDLEEVPIASASIGQVHRARRADTGESIAIKVQYRGIAESIDSDLAVLRRISQGFVALSLKQVDMREVFDEVQLLLKQETDYRLEAQFMERYRELARDLSGFRLPKLHGDLSSRRVLCLGFEEGVSFDRWLASNPTLEQRESLAERFLELYFLEFFAWGFVQTDPNFANFLFHPGSSDVTLLDFGATKEFSVDFRRRYREFLLVTRSGDQAGCVERAIELGLLDPRENAETRRLLYALVRGTISLFEPERQPFAFADSRYVDEVRGHVLAFVKALRYSPPPRQLIFVHRKLGGIYSLLRSLRVSRDLSVYWRKLEAMEFKIIGAPPQGVL